MGSRVRIPAGDIFHIYLLLKLYCLVRNGTIQGDLINGVELTTKIWPAVVFTNYSYCYVVHWEFLPSIVASNVSLNVWSKTGARPNWKKTESSKRATTATSKLLRRPQWGKGQGVSMSIKMSPPRTQRFFLLRNGSFSALFVYFRLFKQTLQFLQDINVKNIHPVYGAGIRTHNLRNMSLLP